MKIRFMSGNENKIREVRRILAPIGVEVVPVSRKIEELQTQDVDALVRDKLIKAFREIGRPLFVEHTGLYLTGLNDLPAGLTQIFWDRLEAERFTDLVAALGNSKVTAKTVLGYCDGRKMYQFSGELATRCTCSRAPSKAPFRADLSVRRTSSGTAYSCQTVTRRRSPRWAPTRTTSPCVAWRWTSLPPTLK